MSLKNHLSNGLSLKSKGCDSGCCKHGSPYVLPNEAERITEEIGYDVFVQEGNHFVIGKNRNGSPRDFDRDYCPFLAKESFLCELQVKDPNLKPTDCYIHPVFLKQNARGEIVVYVSKCCDASSSLPDSFLKKVRKMFDELPEEHRRGMFEHQVRYGFDLVQLSSRGK